MSEPSIKDLLGKKVLKVLDLGNDKGIIFEDGLCLLVDTREPLYDLQLMQARVSMEMEALVLHANKYKKLNEDLKFIQTIETTDKESICGDPKTRSNDTDPVAGTLDVEVRTKPGDSSNKPGTLSGVQELQHEIKRPPSGKNTGGSLL